MFKLWCERGISYLRIYGLFDDFMYQEESCPNIRILKIGERMEQPQKNRHLVDIYVSFVSPLSIAGVFLYQSFFATFIAWFSNECKIQFLMIFQLIMYPIQFVNKTGCTDNQRTRESGKLKLVVNLNKSP